MWADRTKTLWIVAALLAGCQAAPQLIVPPGDGTTEPARAIGPGQAEADFDEAVAMTARGEYDAALSPFRRALAGYDAFGPAQRAAECLFWLGFCHEKLQRRTEAEAHYRQLLTHYAAYRAARLAEARLLRMQAHPVAPEPLPLTPDTAPGP
ncbi:MAG TPA: hypothetical protein DCX07_06130 [Phycisphaerales bacterium]|nr:hypothetical protein [Phycisphaerales bacterium]